MLEAIRDGLGKPPFLGHCGIFCFRYTSCGMFLLKIVETTLAHLLPEMFIFLKNSPSLTN